MGQYFYSSVPKKTKMLCAMKILLALLSKSTLRIQSSGTPGHMQVLGHGSHWLENSLRTFLHLTTSALLGKGWQKLNHLCCLWGSILDLSWHLFSLRSSALSWASGHNLSCNGIRVQFFFCIKANVSHHYKHLYGELDPAKETGGTYNLGISMPNF